MKSLKISVTNLKNVCLLLLQQNKMEIDFVQNPLEKMSYCSKVSEFPVWRKPCGRLRRTREKHRLVNCAGYTAAIITRWKLTETPKRVRGGKRKRRGKILFPKKKLENAARFATNHFCFTTGKGIWNLLLTKKTFAK